MKIFVEEILPLSQARKIRAHTYYIARARCESRVAEIYEEQASHMRDLDMGPLHTDSLLRCERPVAASGRYTRSHPCDEDIRLLARLPTISHVNKQHEYSKSAI